MSFTSTSANPKNTVSAGSMTQDNSADDTAIMKASGMVPGDVVKGSATIENVGEASGDFTLRVKDVTDRSGRTEASSRPGSTSTCTTKTRPRRSGPERWPSSTSSLGTWTPGEERTYRFEVTLPEEGASADNAFQRSKATASFEWNAVQSH